MKLTDVSCGEGKSIRSGDVQGDFFVGFTTGPGKHEYPSIVVSDKPCDVLSAYRNGWSYMASFESVGVAVGMAFYAFKDHWQWLVVEAGSGRVLMRGNNKNFVACSPTVTTAQVSALRRYKQKLEKEGTIGNQRRK